MSPSLPDADFVSPSSEGGPRRTMPPPELWDRTAPDSVSQLVLSDIRSEPPLLRHAGPRAELAHQFARAALCSQNGDSEGERDAYLAVARQLIAHATELDTATAAARRALSLGDDPAVRAELGGWLSGLGEPALAAAALRGIEPKKPSDAAKNLIKIAVLLARAGDAPGAADALREAGALDPSDAMAHELLGMVASWAPDDMPPVEAAAAYGHAADQRTAAGDLDAAFEDRLRAFEIAPSHEPAARALAASVAERSAAAADEVLRAHAAAVSGTDPGQALAIHRERMRTAAAEGDAGRAVGALLDAWLEGDVGGDHAEEADAVLLQAGLGEMVAARLALYAEERDGEAAAGAHLSLGKLYAGSLASPDRAADAFADAFVTDPRATEAMTLLAHHADDTHDPWPLVEALVRIGMRAHASYAEPNQASARVSALSELSALAEDKLSDPYLASWALRRLVDAGSSQGVGARLDRLSPRLRLQEDAYEQALGRLAAAEEPAERVLTLRRALAFYRGRPEESETYFKLASELLALAPSDASAAEDVVRAALRAKKEDELVAILRDRSAALAGRVVAAHARALVRLCDLLRRRGDDEGALAALVEALAEPDVADSVASAALVHACRLRAVKERAEALAVLAGSVAPAVAGQLLAVAVDLWMVTGEPDRALAMSLRAVRTDPTSPRAIVARAGAALGRSDRESVEAVEQAMAAVVPRGLFCDALAEALGELGERELSFGWTQRWLALRPASPEASEALLTRALAFGDAQALADALGAVLAQPRPPGGFSDLAADVLDALLERDKAKAVVLARRVLDVFGPKDIRPSPALGDDEPPASRGAPLRERLLAIAERAGDAALAITVLERWIATGLTGAEAATAAMDLAERRAAAGDFAAAARLLSRAVAAGHDPEAVLAAIEPLFPEVETRLAEATPVAGAALSDALVSLAEARALALAACGDAPTAPDSAPRDAVPRAVDASFAYRAWGGLLWDLAADPIGAENAFFQASLLVPEGAERYARDMRAFAGALPAIDALLARVAQLGDEPDDRRRRAALLIESAIVAHGAGQHERALEQAAAAIELDPSRTDAVVLVERSAHVSGGVAVLDRTYDVLAAAALGRFGRRAAHYRAARQLERRGAVEPAMEHAIEAFEALPTEGTTFVLLSRLAERAADPAEAVRSILRVAEAASEGAKPRWLKRAAALAGRSDEGLRTRFDILLRALLVRPDVGSITDLAAALRDLIGATGDKDTPALRIDRAMRALLPKLDGPDGARAGVALARLAIESLHDLPLGIFAVERSFAADGDIEDYLLLVDLVPAFVAEPEASARFVAGVAASASKPYSSVGASLLRFASTLAEALGDAHAAAALLVEAARRVPEEDDLVYRAEAAVAALGDPDLAAVLDRAVPRVTRIETLLRIAEKGEPAGQDTLAIAALSRALDLQADLQAVERAAALAAAAAGAASSRNPAPPPPQSPLETAETRERIVAWLRRLFAMAGRPEAIEELLRNELSRAELRPAARVRYARDLGAILSGRGKHTHALEVLAEALAGLAVDDEALADLRRFGRRARDLRALLDALAQLLGAAPDDATHAAIEREIEAVSETPAPLFEGLEGPSGPSSIARAAMDGQILEALEQDANRRGDHAAVADFLERRIAIAEFPDVRRMLRLRRVAVLEQRLGRTAEAGAELQAQLAETPDDVIALRYLGDIRERSGDLLGAAELWDHLSQIAPTTDEKAEYGVRSTADLIAGGDLARARESLDRIAAIAPRENVVELRAQIARQEGDFVALAAALEQLASSTREPPSRRAELLVEAARASASAGDEAASLERARRALKLAPDYPEAILETVRAEYRLRGPGTPREAQAAVTELQRVADRVPDAHIDLHVFLLAEEMDVIQGGGAGMRELSRRHAEVGALPLIALGMAERLVRSKSFEPAVALFETALAGDLRGLRARGRVALAAAEAAAAEGDAESRARAHAFLEIAAAEPDTRALALRREAELTTGFAPHADLREPPLHAGPPPLPQEPSARRPAIAPAQPAAIAPAQPAAIAPAQPAAIAPAQPPAIAPAQRLAIAPAQRLAIAPARQAGPPPLPSTARPASPPPPLPPSPAADPSDADPPAADPLDVASPETTASPATVVSPAAGASPAASPSRTANPSPVTGSLEVVGQSPADGLSPAPTPPLPTPASAEASVPVSDPVPSSMPASMQELDEPDLDDIATVIGDAIDVDAIVAGAIFDIAPPTLPAAAAGAGADASAAVVTRDVGASLPRTDGRPPPLPAVTFQPSTRSLSPFPGIPAVSVSAPPADSDEAALRRELMAGSFEAGEQLIALYGQDAIARSRDIVAVRRQQAAIRPGDLVALAHLHEAAALDGNAPFANAVEHVLGVFDSSGGAPPPPLSAQRDAPALVSSLLFRQVDSAVNEALAIVWETGLYRREPASYGLTGVERVQPNAGTHLAETFASLLRLFGLGRVWLFHRRTPGPARAEVALLASPSVVLSGDVFTDSPALLYALGAALTGSMPEHALVNGTPEDELATLIDALVAAFGPLDAAPRGNRAVVRLEQSLWQLIPPRAERRLREICAHPDAFTLENAVQSTRQAMRRAGLFASGSLATAVAEVASETGYDLEPLRTTLDGLSRACLENPAIADLVRLSIRTEYAEARWLPPRSELQGPESRRSRYG